MAATQAAVRPICCDGCTLVATPDHLRCRIARLEWASRFRPIHISTLFVMPAPPTRPEDHFYYPGALPRDPAARALFEDLSDACGVSRAEENRESALRQFQQSGFFLAEAVECPVEPGAEAEEESLLARLAPTLVRRIRLSYRPKAVLLLSERLRPVAEALASSVEAQLLLWRGAPVALSEPGDAAGRKRFRSQISGLLENSASA